MSLEFHALEVLAPVLQLQEEHPVEVARAAVLMGPSHG